MKGRIKLSKRFTSAVITALVFLLVITTTAYAATTETFYGGYSSQDVKGSIVVELTNISSKENVILSEADAEVYFDDPEILEMAVYYDYDEDRVITIKDVLEYYNNFNGGVPVYYADSAPVSVVAKSALRTFYFSYKGDHIAYSYEPIFYSFDEYVNDFENKQVYTERPGHWLIADGTSAVLHEPGKYIFIFTDDGLISSSPAAVFCIHIGDTQSGENTIPENTSSEDTLSEDTSSENTQPETTTTENDSSETQVPEDLSENTQSETSDSKELNKINVNPTTSTVLVNGKAVEFEAYNVNGYNYFKIRDLAQAVNNTEKNFEVTWDGVNNAILLISNKNYTPVGGELTKGDGQAKVATPTTSKIYKDGEEIALTAYNINGYNYFKLRDIAKAFDFGVTWDGATNTISIDTSTNYVDE